MSHCRTAFATGQHESFERWYDSIDAVNLVFHGFEVGFIDATRGFHGDGVCSQITANIEQYMVYDKQKFVSVVQVEIGEEKTKVAIQFRDRARGIQPHYVLGHACASHKTGLAFGAGACINQTFFNVIADSSVIIAKS